MPRRKPNSARHLDGRNRHQARLDGGDFDPERRSSGSGEGNSFRRGNPRLKAWNRCHSRTSRDAQRHVPKSLEKRSPEMTEGNHRAEHYFAALPKSEAKLGIICTTLRGKSFEFLTAASVFSKKRVDPGTRLLIEAMALPETGAVLDVGCGYGAVGIAAGASHPRPDQGLKGGE